MARIDIFIALTFITIVGSKKLHISPKSGDEVLDVKRCMCDLRINGVQGTVVHDFGVISRHINYPVGSCHRLRQECRRKCDGQAKNLTESHNIGPLHGKINGLKFGYKTCVDHYKELLGQKKQSIVAVSHTPGCQHHKNHLHMGHWKESICCGISLLFLEDKNAARVIGWNPDCAYNEYVIA